MYKFVKIKRGKESGGTWYFVPRTEEQVLEHFNTVFAAEIKAGMQDRIDHSHYIEDKTSPDGGRWYTEHPVTPWARAVQVYLDLHGGNWAIAAAKLETETLNQRMASFRSGKTMYLDNGVVESRPCNEDEILEEMEKDTLEYPIETQFRFEDVRYMKWDMPDLRIKGTHWYAKIGNRDVKDKDGNCKWDTIEEAHKAAEWFVEELNLRRYNR